MRTLLILVSSSFLLSACGSVGYEAGPVTESVQAVSTQKKSGSSEQEQAQAKQREKRPTLSEEVFSLVEKHRHQSEYAFRLLLDESTPYELNGKQSGDDWELHDKRKKLEIKKKGDQIELASNGKKETLAPEQFGLISPDDHLELLTSAMGNVIQLPQKKWGGELFSSVRVDLDPKTVENKLMERLGSGFQDPAAAKRASELTEVVYELWYDRKTGALIQLRIQIGEQSEDMVYLFPQE
ncbi:hypothetical protein [Mechercharimyces sp. CAU 1602]|uniref:hypothetical protein n=1 Tax=Mechercharimyces sp. CAU 1602 TaxID=2973933 RepID=UPI002163D954|nr:hypothetical protein [Mechercharimyces sp. CAU 1602]MCS1351030.1 hypothetical protein [Mechercharimyces sp. CAU 1602]